MTPVPTFSIVPAHSIPIGFDVPLGAGSDVFLDDVHVQLFEQRDCFIAGVGDGPRFDLGDPFEIATVVAVADDDVTFRVRGE